MGESLFPPNTMKPGFGPEGPTAGWERKRGVKRG